MDCLKYKTKDDNKSNFGKTILRTVEKSFEKMVLK